MAARWQVISLGLSLVVALLLTGLGLWESSPAGGADWAAYQATYARLTASGAATSGEVEREIRQIEIPALNRVDRCTTCHLAVTDPALALSGAPEPFRAHGPILSSHPPERFGCTVCHGGVGRAVNLPEAHGESGIGPERLLRGPLIQSRCYVCHGSETLPPADTALVAEGIKWVNTDKCLRCHQMDGVGGSEGPDLSAIAAQRDWVEMYAHLLNPQAMTPGSTMPALSLTREAATGITAFLLTRLDARTGVRDVTYIAGQPVSATPSILSSEAMRLADAEFAPPRYDGATLFEGLGCRVCHRVGLRGGEVGPALTHIGRVRDEAWLRQLLVEPAAIFPDGQMPAYALSEAQLDAIVNYLLSRR